MRPLQLLWTVRREARVATGSSSHAVKDADAGAAVAAAARRCVGSFWVCEQPMRRRCTLAARLCCDGAG